MRIYTKTGDQGQTGLFAGPRVAKDDVRIEAYGTVDELNAALGVARAARPAAAIDVLLGRIQNELFDLGAELATPDPQAHGTNLVNEADIQALEAAIDEHEQALEPLKQFILPAGTPAAAALHLARGICRRAERRVVSLHREQEGKISISTIQYLNRLGDLLFVLSRAENASARQPDVAWQKRPRL